MDFPWNHPPHWHAINVHLPIVLAVLGLPLICWIAITRGRSRALRWWSVAIYAVLALSAFYAAQTGERAREALSPELPAVAWDQVNFHEWMAEQLWPIALLTALMLGLANIPRRWARQTFLTLGLVGSVLTTGWMIVTAHSGGVAVYEHGLGTIATRVQPDAPQREVVEVRSIEPRSSELVSFVRDIRPMLSTRCAECHAGEEPKGGYSVLTYAGLLGSGKKSGPGVVPGNPDQSSIIKYVEGTLQPRMPKDKRALGAEQIELLRRWIAQGAIDDSVSQIVTSAAQVHEDEFDPALPWKAEESAAVRRFLRLKHLPPPPAIPQVAAPALNPIDNFIAAKWDESAAVPEVCDDATYLRRVYLDVIGMIPSIEEARRFVASDDPDKRAKLVDELLARNEDYAMHWLPFWEDALCSNGLHQGGVGTRGNFRPFLMESFTSNKPYDIMVRELIDPTMPRHPGRYVLNDNHTRTMQSAADTAQVFLGTAMKCASCHNHFLNAEWPQERAVAFAGLFTEKNLEIIRCERSTGQFVEAHFMFDLPGAPKEAPQELNHRLRRVAQLITDPTNPRFSRAIVNRLWKRYMGLGLVEPHDDFREDIAPSHPELLDWLADDLARHGFDLKRTTRLILTSRTYQLCFDPALADVYDAEEPDAPRYFRSPALRRLTAEQLLDSIHVAVNQKRPERRACLDDESTVLTRSLGRPATRNEVSTQRPDDTAVVQSLELLNGQEYHDRVYRGEILSALANNSDRATVVEELYWAALSRAPTQDELRAGVEFLESAPSAQSIGDMLWVLLTTPEFHYVR